MPSPIKEYPSYIRFRLTETQKEQAEKKARSLGFSSVSEMLRAFIDGSVKVA